MFDIYTKVWRFVAKSNRKPIKFYVNILSKQFAVDIFNKQLCFDQCQNLTCLIILEDHKEEKREVKERFISFIA